MATGTVLPRAFPLGSRINERGRLEVGGCDTIELAREFGTPAYVVAEDDLRTRARAFRDAALQSGHPDLQIVFASKAFPCTAVLAVFAGEGLWCDVASAGELHLALAARFAPERIVMHGNAKSLQELRAALSCRLGAIVIDNFDEIERLAGLLDERRSEARAEGGEGTAGTGAQAVLVRVNPDVRGDTHEKISTGHADSKFGFAFEQAPAAIERIRQVEDLQLLGVHAHIGSQLLELEPFRREIAQLARLGSFPMWDFGGGLGVRYTDFQPEPPAIDEWVAAIVGAAQENGIGHGARLLIEPGRSLCANACVTLYTVEAVKPGLTRWVAVDGGMSDNLRPMLYAAPYEAYVADRLGAGSEYVLAGKHCESGDVITHHAFLEDPRAGDVIVTPATGAYGYAMANNYNGIPRPPVIFCRDGDARVVVRRERLEDLTARDVD